MSLDCLASQDNSMCKAGILLIELLAVSLDCLASQDNGNATCKAGILLIILVSRVSSKLNHLLEIAIANTQNNCSQVSWYLGPYVNKYTYYTAADW